MPTYLFLDKNTNKEFTQFMGISEADAFLEANPHIERLVNGCPPIGDPLRLGVTKNDEGFRDLLREVKRKHRGNTIDVR